MKPQLVISDVRRDFAESEKKSVREAVQPGVAEGGGDGGNGDHIGKMEERVAKAEVEIAFIKGSLDWAKLVATVILGVMLAGFSLLAALTFSASNRSDASASKLEAQVSSVSAKIADEFRAQRQDQSAQMSAIANAITATKQQAPQVILVPAPAPGAKQP